MNEQLKQARLLPPPTLSNFGKRVWERTVGDPDFPGISRAASRRELLAYCRLAETVRENEVLRICEQSRLAENWLEDGAAIRDLVEESRQELADMKVRIFAR